MSSSQLIERKLNQLPSKFTFSPDGYPPIFLKCLSNVLAFPLQLLFESSFASGMIPHQWKSSVIIPLHKKGNRSQPTSYRPIALTSVICKVMESIIVDTLSTYLKSNNLISDAQHGFIRKRSPCTQLLQSLDDWTMAVDRKSQTDVLHIDFARAFDSLSFRKLITKLKHFGIGYELLRWISEFIIGRRQQVKIDNTLSSAVPVLSGVPQGSVLGPCLFLIYINDITYAAKENCKVRLFADDVKVYTDDFKGNFRNLSNTLTEISRWSSAWQLFPSIHKCKSITFGKNNINQPYFLNESQIIKVTSLSDIGITFSSDLKFSLHCHSIASKALSRAYTVLKCLVTNDPRILIKAYCAYVRPMLEYCTQIWCPFLVKDIKCGKSTEILHKASVSSCLSNIQQLLLST